MIRLSKYDELMKKFEKEFENAKKNSIFEFSIISLVIIERKDFGKFQNERINCPNRIEKILFHGTSIDPISSILNDEFKKSEIHIFGEGIYFTDSLDYCWYYGGDNDNRKNINKIPKIDEKFSLIASIVYYNSQGLKYVENGNYNPKKNEINKRIADVYTNTKNNYYNISDQLLFNEYVVNDLDQICPFIGARLKREEFCVIWRDINFSPNSIFNNKYDELFKNFLKERIKYIEKLSKFNIYTFDNSEDALKLINRKKFNKIILISNIGDDYGGRNFIINARKILGNDVIALFLSYNSNHLHWVKNFKNALFSNDPNFYERYLNCFSEKNESEIKNTLINLKELIEAYYNVNFYFDDNFLKYPLFEQANNAGQYSSLNI